MGSFIQTYLELIILLLILYGSFILLQRYQSRRVFRDNSFLYKQFEVRSPVPALTFHENLKCYWETYKIVVEK